MSEHGSLLALFLLSEVFWMIRSILWDATRCREWNRNGTILIFVPVIRISGWDNKKPPKRREKKGGTKHE